MNERQRELGTIDDVWSGVEDHGVLTCNIGVNFGGTHQGFGGLCLDPESLKAFVAELCEAFGVRDREALVGQRCYALRALGEWNEPIERLESLGTGRRFTITGFRRRHYPKHATSRLEDEIRSARGEIEWAQRRANEARERLARLESNESGYVDWEVQDTGKP